jgi:hypothetical protein
MVRAQGQCRIPVPRALTSALAVLCACFGCQGGYPIPASQCDQWCDASQLTFCGNYDPAGCVLTCNQRGGDATECRTELDTLLACLRNQSSHELECQTWLYEGTPPCLDEEYAYELCAAPHAPGGDGRFNWR